MNLVAGSATTCPATVRDVVGNACHHRRSCRENQTTQPIIVICLCPCHSKHHRQCPRLSSQSIFFVISHDSRVKQKPCCPSTSGFKPQGKNYHEPTINFDFELRTPTSECQHLNFELKLAESQNAKANVLICLNQRGEILLWHLTTTKSDKKKNISRQGMSNLIT